MAKWIKAISRVPHLEYGNAYRSCSACGEPQYLPLRSRYCSMCGVKMDRPLSYNYNDFDEDEFKDEEQKTYRIAFLFENNTWIFSKQRRFAYILNCYDFETEEDAFEFFKSNEDYFKEATFNLSGNSHVTVIYKRRLQVYV